MVSLIEERAERQDVRFPSGDTQCAAWLYRPPGERRAPCIVLAHGFGALKERRLDAYAERFAAVGYGALVFDYRHFGESGGEPRQLVNTRRQHQDWQAALRFVRGLDGIDPGRIVAWGSSNSGGHFEASVADQLDFLARHLG
jgi:uncharacterized protein